MHWTNGKRHMHGLPVLRKQANRKDRFYPPKEILFQTIEDIMNDILPKRMNEVFKTFASAEDICKK